MTTWNQHELDELIDRAARDGPLLVQCVDGNKSTSLRARLYKRLRQREQEGEVVPALKLVVRAAVLQISLREDEPSPILTVTAVGQTDEEPEL
jgi:hypothetical protein